MKLFKTALLLSLTSLLGGCEADLKTGKGFTLPDGNASRGSALFVELGCNVCHSIHNTPAIEQPEHSQHNVVLGGPVIRIQTYGELVTSIINPSHKLAHGYAKQDISQNGESVMPSYNSTMTIDQLIDLVAFLQGQYELKPYTPSNYRPYPL